MKKLILIAALSAGCFGNATAQTETADVAGVGNNTSDLFRRLRFGAYVAPTLSWMKPTATKDGDRTQQSGGKKVGLTYGLLADYYFADNYALATGLQINSTGGIIQTTNPKAANGEVLKSNVDYSLQFLEIPVALKLKTDRMGKFSFFGQAGLTMAINISKKATYEVVQKRATADTVFKADAKEKLKGSVGNIIPVLFQMNIGVGTQYAIGPKLDAYIGIFFNNGFAPNVTDPTKFSNFPQFSDGSTRLNNFALRMGLYF